MPLLLLIRSLEDGPKPQLVRARINAGEFLPIGAQHTSQDPSLVRLIDPVQVFAGWVAPNVDAARRRTIRGTVRREKLAVVP